jgi:capsular polysaccharide biosynthesis protein
MDLLSIGQMLWRRKFFTIPVLVLTCVAAVYIVKVKPPTYEASSSVLLTNPPTQATNAQIAADPSLKGASAYNTFTQYGDLQVVANTVIDLITNPAAQPALSQAGVGPNYTLTLSTDYGDPPIVVINGVGTSGQSAINSAEVLTQTFKSDLYQIQKSQGVNPFFMITADNYVAPSTATTESSGKLRTLVTLLAAGVILLLLGVSMAESIDKRRRPRLGPEAKSPAGSRRNDSGNGRSNGGSDRAWRDQGEDAPRYTRDEPQYARDEPTASRYPRA